jgi:general secretion pathway protein F
MLQRVSAGRPFSEAMAAAGFSADESGLIRAGEPAGSLVPVLEELASLLERRAALREKLVSALVYPLFLMTLAPVSLIVIATVLVPNLAPIFESSHAPVPVILRVMMAAGKLAQDHGVTALVLLLLGALLVALAVRKPARRAAWAASFKRLPLFRSVQQRAETARICRTLGALLRSGSPLQTALTAVSQTAPDPRTRQHLAEARNAAARGDKLHRALGLLPSFTPTQLQMIAIGEETNTLPAMLLYVADSEEQQLASTIDRAMALLTPILTVAIGLMVGGIVMSIMNAILSVNDLAAP